MNQRSVLYFLEDILKAIDAIERFVFNMNYKVFASDDKTIRAVEREFEIIGEAVKKKFLSRLLGNILIYLGKRLQA